MEIKEILNEKEIEDYHQQWDLFKQKYFSQGKPTIETEYHTHSGMPVISKIFQFKDKPLFRTHVFQKKLRKFDPYLIFKTYGNPFWHIAHYLMVSEQMYHASMRNIRDTNKFAVIDAPLEFKLSSPIFWDDTITTEFILNPKRQTEKYLIEDCYFNFYNNKTNEIKGSASFRTFVRLRAYIQDIEKLKQGNENITKNLINKIETQHIYHRRLLKPRTNLPSKEYLISELNAGRILEQELHNYFSDWDKEN